ncbi:hypothetical protein Taro_044344 [Colocasia esculenta]|uniref:Myb-like domain-containing protein n=1 Tax=Colocasia esculenta TaxID=4460 RepID=A0A843WTT1_COLES|nr:hypothetical protein [Colocasia esculenta]
MLPTKKKREQRNGVVVNMRDMAEKGEVEETEWNYKDFEILKKRRGPRAGDSFTQFLRQRKPIDKRAKVANPELSTPDPSKNGEAKDGDANSGGGGSWSSGEDIALLNALKAFPKDAPTRWDKISAAVPGRSKVALTRKRMSSVEEGEEETKKTPPPPSRRRTVAGGDMAAAV